MAAHIVFGFGEVWGWIHVTEMYPYAPIQIHQMVFKTITTGQDMDTT